MFLNKCFLVPGVRGEDGPSGKIQEGRAKKNGRLLAPVKVLLVKLILRSRVERQM